MFGGALRLFTVRPDQVYEHPPELPLEAMAIPLGPLEGYDVYAYNFDGNPAEVIGPFTATIEKDRFGPVIRPPGRRHTTFNFSTDDGGICKPTIPCWYQSGATLRFVRKRKSQ